jgi:hypothetical protein
MIQKQTNSGSHWSAKRSSRHSRNAVHGLAERERYALIHTERRADSFWDSAFGLRGIAFLSFQFRYTPGDV